ncbi:hypothetical protein AQUCO_03700209v1 [Aquilegia coerulea]|uniref:Uncharacterized protein n=1 Tax=Aquilegia coerulea TaxID=218851 RepID=A0A2G5CU15_AQUCA|nr:hypothetical protein AQUCO_03700209v1 [Aquilegia coerulea]
MKYELNNDNKGKEVVSNSSIATLLEKLEEKTKQKENKINESEFQKRKSVLRSKVEEDHVDDVGVCVSSDAVTKSKKQGSLMSAK